MKNKIIKIKDEIKGSSGRIRKIQKNFYPTYLNEVFSEGFADTLQY